MRHDSLELSGSDLKSHQLQRTRRRQRIFPFFSVFGREKLWSAYDRSNHSFLFMSRASRGDSSFYPTHRRHPFNTHFDPVSNPRNCACSACPRLSDSAGTPGACVHVHQKIDAEKKKYELSVKRTHTLPLITRRRTSKKKLN